MSHNHIPINPKLLTWARERAGLAELALESRFPKLAEWESGTLQPTLTQLENFARAVHIPIGYLFLPQPIEETLPIPDFRTMADVSLTQPSPNLLDTLYLCQQRQDWYRDYARIHAQSPLDFIGSANPRQDPRLVAVSIADRLKISPQERQQKPTWVEALRFMLAQTEEAGILVMASGIVGSNSHRKLDVAEFRGFAMADDLAPLIFLNGADSKSGQMFTMAHELAHLWLGESGVFDTEAGNIPDQEIERWCNQVAAELLMPMESTRKAYQADRAIPDEIQRLARQFKVSTLVVLRRLFDAGFIDQATLWQAYKEELARIEAINQKSSGGGDFYRTLGARTGKLFARAVLSSTLEGQTLFQDAFRLLGVRKNATFYKAAREFGVTQ